MSFSVSAHKGIHSQQVKEHRTAVLDFTEDYLKSILFYLKDHMWHFTIGGMQPLALLAEDCNVSLYIMILLPEKQF